MNNTINTTEGTLVHTILSHFLNNTNLVFETNKDARKYIEDELLINISRQAFNTYIKSYNDGGYNVDGVTADQQKINFKEKQNLCDVISDDTELDDADLEEINNEVTANKIEKPDACDWIKLCSEANIDPRLTKLWWDKRDGDMSICYVNPIPPKVRKYNLDEALESVVDKINTDKLTKWKPVQKDSQKGLNVVITDAHVGMHIDEGGIFEYEYDGCIYKEKMQEVFSNIMKEYRTHGHFDVVVINNLGDQEDGWDQLTTRGGHKLPQNMTETEVFKLCVETHVEMIESILEQNITNKVILRSCINSNHSATFSEIVATGVKLIIDRMYDSDVVEIDILDKFMSHRTFGDHTFILTHGKDKKQMFRGLPLYLNDKTTNYINDYIRHYGIDTPHIHVQKGDLHQIGFEKKVNFDYRNFGSFSPPSSWVQHNFGDSYSCYTIQVIEKYSAEISSTDYFLDYRKAN